MQELPSYFDTHERAETFIILPCYNIDVKLITHSQPLYMSMAIPNRDQVTLMHATLTSDTAIVLWFFSKFHAPIWSCKVYIFMSAEGTPPVSGTTTRNCLIS